MRRWEDRWAAIIRFKGAEIELFDEFGKRLDRRLVMPNQTSYSFEVEVDKVPNKYFVRTFTAEGRSTTASARAWPPIRASRSLAAWWRPAPSPSSRWTSPTRSRRPARRG